MSDSYRMRPRFELQLPISNEEVLQRFSTLLEDKERQCEGYIRKQEICLRVPEEERHLWSPQLNITLSVPNEGTGSKLNGLIGPSAVVWTCFMAGYAAVSFFLFVAAILGYAQWTTEQTPWGFYLLPVLGVVGLLLWSLSQLGQRFAKEQMEQLRDLLGEALEATP